jgi:hypothetical protein
MERSLANSHTANIDAFEKATIARNRQQLDWKIRLKLLG